MAKKLKQNAIPLPVVRKNKAGSWGHATGRVWCLEKDLLGRPGLDRLYAAESVDDVRRLLLEHRYPQKDTVEGMVMDENCRLYELLDEVTPDDGYHQVLLLCKDAHNLKTSLKTAFMADPPAEDEFKSWLLRPSLIQADTLWCAVARGEKEKNLPAWAQAMVSRAKEAFLAAHDASAMDRSVDRDIHALIAEIAAGFDDAWLAGYFDRVRDLANLETLLRVRARAMELPASADSLLADGIIRRETWLSFFDAPVQAVTEGLEKTPYQPLSGHLITYGEGGASLFSLDVDRLLFGYLEAGSRTLSGPPRVIAYIMAREREFKNVRIVMASLTDGVSREAAGPLRRDF
ncbi:MAG: hypothetical protein GX819_02865 [Clostridiaceae bacterium]|nr:hypothetical protein [Clostridiaceae bacterium]